MGKGRQGHGGVVVSVVPLAMHVDEFWEGGDSEGTLKNGVYMFGC